MPNYHPNAKSLVYGLSDFWTLYFKELPVIEELYRGMEIDIGQVYLDLLALLLNNSVRDAATFNKQFFKLLRISEDTVVYSGDGKYSIALDTDVAGVKYLNNRVFNVTDALERGVDFLFDTKTRSLLLDYDPFAYYRARTFGTLNSAFTVTSLLGDPAAADITLELVNSATYPPTLTRTQYALRVDFDATKTVVSEVVSLLNSNTSSNGIVRATLADLSTGTGAPVAFGPTALQRQSSAPLEGFATRTYEVAFGTRFTDPGVSRWTDLDVQKGDVLRITGGPGFGAPAEFPIQLVRDDALYLYPQAAPVDLSGKLGYSILRSPADDMSVDEPYVPSGYYVQHWGTCPVTAATRSIVFPVALSQSMIGEVMILGSAANAGEYRISAISGTTLTLDGNPLIDEAECPTGFCFSSLAWGTDGVLTATSATTATFTSATGGFGAALEGGVLKTTIGGVLYRYAVTTYVNANTLHVTSSTGFVTGSGIDFAIAAVRPGDNQLAYSAPVGCPVPGTVQVVARRALDGEAVLEGRDYTVDVDTGIVRALTVWQPSITNRVTYQFRLIQRTTATSLQTGSGGTFLSGPYRFQDPLAAFNATHIGARLNVSLTNNGANNGDYFIESIVSATEVTLSSDHVPVLPETNNGFLHWALYPAGGVQVTDVVETVTEMGLWATDALIDKYHLYYTYGYLIKRVETSSEAYRSLIRGIFQLFMLGPTLERFEAAINTVAGLSTIRDDGEILLSYSNGALRSGNDGVFDTTSSTFTSASAIFTVEDLNRRIFVSSGFNQNKLFSIAAVLSSTVVRLLETPITDTSVSWELTATGTHTITTSRATYTYPRSAPLKAKYLDATNWGVLTLRAFEVVTSAFEVTDYVETPTWWESVQIPATLLPDYSAGRRQATPALFENVVGPGDGACVGDPGLYIGADDDGVTVPSSTLRVGTLGTLYGDPQYPVRATETYFEAATGAFTDNDVGNYLVVGTTRYLITSRVSSTRVKIRSFVPIAPAGVAAATWSLVTGTLPLRHTAAYVILDKYLKHHLFTVRFDVFLLEQLPVNVIQDLQELVFVAKPSYTYLTLTPAAIFEDLIRITEPSFTIGTKQYLGGTGSAGMSIVADPNLSLTIGSDWMIGGWFRYASNTGSFVLPTTSVANILGTAPAGLEYKVTSLFITPTTYKASGVPLPLDAFVMKASNSGISGAITPIDAQTARLTTPGLLATTSSDLFLQYVTIASGANVGRWRIGSVVSSTEVLIFLPSAATTTNEAWTVYTNGANRGQLTVTATGESRFVDLTQMHGFTTPDIGTYIRRPSTSAAGIQIYRVDGIVDTVTARVAENYPMQPAGTTFVVSTTGNTVTLTNADFTIDPSMCRANRYATAPATADKTWYYITFQSGALAGTSLRLETYVSGTSVQLNTGSLGTYTGLTATFSRIEHYSADTSGATDLWEHLSHATYVDNVAGTPGTLYAPGGQDAGTATYEAFGVLEPSTPFTLGPDLTNGDTLYTIGGGRAYSRYMRSRSGRDMDMMESPLQIKITANTLQSFDGVTIITSDYDIVMP